MFTIDDAKFTAGSPTHVILADSRSHRLLIVDSAARKLYAIGREGQGPGEFQAPNAVETLPDGGFLVWDYFGARLTKLDSAGSYVSSKRVQRVGPMKMTRIPDGQVVLNFGLIQPTNALYRSVLFYRPSSALLDTVTVTGWEGVDASSLYNVAVGFHGDGGLVVADGSDYRIHVLTIPESRIVSTTPPVDPSFRPATFRPSPSAPGVQYLSVPNTIDLINEVPGYGYLVASASFSSALMQSSRFLDVVSFEGELIQRLALEPGVRMTDLLKVGEDFYFLVATDGREALPSIHVLRANRESLFGK